MMRVLALGLSVLVLAVTASGLEASAEGDDFLAQDWGSGFQSCGGARTPVSFRIAGPESNVIANGIVTCRDDGDAFIYAVDYVNFLLNPQGNWPQASLQWFGVGAQRAGANGRNDWFFDEVRPIRVQIPAPGRRVAISNLSFRVPKAVLMQARGFGFYAVGGGVFWPILLRSRVESVAAPRPAQQDSLPPMPALSISAAAPGAPDKPVTPDVPKLAVEQAEWGANFPTCAGARTAIPLKAASAGNDTLLANGIINCADDGDAFVYSVDYMNFSLAPGSKRPSATLEWFGCGAQRAGASGRNEWIFDEAKPIQAQVKAGVARVGITQVTCRVPKSTLSRARGFGFYVVGGGTLWSIYLL
ncbi:hypothetical protein [Bradyrhizobium sp.]|uniref:hypothetical protein n=1 Tax=Bradyrhizobium sp. TaxID=376 RepID=UPI0025C21762|nr:hypothetical protein [Bradyrhizobium sp.]